jgi:hypothetical protein
MQREFELGLATLASGETAAGAQAFVRGAGRHARFGDAGPDEPGGGPAAR